MILICCGWLVITSIGANQTCQTAFGEEPPCQQQNIHEQKNVKLKYLALGDSYTIGEAVDESDRWPVQLTRMLAAENIFLAPPTIVAKTGWTTDELDSAIDHEKLENEFDFVTLLIGVNNQYRQRPVDTYKLEFEKLLQRAIGFARGRSDRVIVVSIPDYGVTPFVAKKFNESPAEDSKFVASRIANELDSYNAAARSITLAHGAHWVDITVVSRESGAAPEMLAEDGLHPSARMYELWSKAIAPAAIQSLQDQK